MDQIGALASAPRHVRRDVTGQKILAHRSEEVDHLCILGKKDFCSIPPGITARSPGLNVRSSVPIRKPSCAFNHPNKLLMRVPVHGDMRVRLHSPIDHRALFAGYDATANLVGDLLLGH